jgi:hypothetical protein
MTKTISALTLATHDLAHAVRFDRTLECELLHGGAGMSLPTLFGPTVRVTRTLLGLLLVVITGLSAGCRDSSTASASPPLPVVKVEPVVEKDVPIYGEWVGTTGA